MAKNRSAKKELNSRKAKVRRWNSRRSCHQPGIECLENRAMLSAIVWANRAAFDTEFGENTAAAREVIDQALRDWEAVIESFNYRKVGQNGWAPSRAYTINIGVKDLPGLRGEAGPLGIDGDGKPFSGVMSIDDNGGGDEWYFDASPGNDYEFPSPVAPFASAGGPAGADLYSTVLHELGHALGFVSGSNLAINNRIDEYHVFRFNDGTHAIFETDDAHTDDGIHPNDLMNPSRPTGMRRTISDLDARILGEGYGYSIDLRDVYNRTFVTTYDPTSRVLTIHGDLGTTLNPHTPVDRIYLNVMADDIFVDVNGYRKTKSTRSVDSIVVIGGQSRDEISVEATRAGIPLTIDAGDGDNSVLLSPNLHNLNHIQGDVHVFQDGDPTIVSFQDENNTVARTFSVDRQFVTFSGSSARIWYGNHERRVANVAQLVLRGGSGGNTFSVSNLSADQTLTRILAGTSNDVVNVFATGKKGLNIDGVAGVDQVTVGAGWLNGLRDILGSVYVSNSNGYTNLILDDSGDTSASRNIRLNDTSVSGLGPVPIGFDPRGIQSLTVLASNDLGGSGNAITVLNTPQNRSRNLAVNLKTGRNKDSVRVDATSSSLFIDGQNGLDRVFVGKGKMGSSIRGDVTVRNQFSFTNLFLDNSADTVRQYAAMTDSSFFVGSAKINFVQGDLQSLAFFGGIGGSFWVFDTPQNGRGTVTTFVYGGAGVDTVNVQKTSGALKIIGEGGRDTVNIGNNGRLHQINGAIDISNPPLGGYTTLNIDGSQEDVSYKHDNVVLDSGSVRGLAPADIRFVQNDLALLTVSAGSGGHTFNVVNTPRNGLTLNTGSGVDTVNVQQISSGTTVNGQNGSDIVNVGLNGNMQGITNTLAITNLSNRSTINLDDSNNSQPRSITMDVVNSVVNSGFGIFGSVDFDGLASGQILYKQADFRALNVWGGYGNNTFTVVNTAANGVDPITTIHAGEGGDALQVLGTTGRLVIDPQGNDNIMVIGGPVGTTGGTLDRILGDIVLEGDPEPIGNQVEIRDAASTGQYAYWMDSQRIYRTSLGGGSPTGNVYLNSYRLNGLTLAGAGNGNGFQIDGTPNLYTSELVNPIKILTGNGNDHVAIFGGSHPLDVVLGSGVYQTVRLGDATHSLDAIQGEVSISGAGFIDTYISDEASTTPKNVTIDHDVINRQIVERYERELVNGAYPKLNTFQFAFSNQGRVNYQAGEANDDINEIVLRGVAANAEIVVSGGPDTDLFAAGFGPDASRILGPVTFHSPQADYDFAYFYDYANPNPQAYTLRTNPLDSSGVRVERSGMSTITYNGLTQLVYYSPLVGGNITNIQSLPANLYLNMVVSDGDAVTLGSAAPGLGGTMANIAGWIQVASYSVDDAVSLTLDDSGNTTTARDVTIVDYQGQISWGVITGLTGSAAINFRDYENWNVDIRGGALDDSFVMSGRVLNASVSIDGGAGDDILVGSGGNWLSGGAGRDLLFAGGLSSVLDGGLDEDILIGGRINDFSLSNLNAIRTVWKGNGAYDSRVSLLRDTRLSDDKVTGNGGLDVLTGGLDALDLFFGGLVTDLQEDEEVVPLF